MKFLALIWLCKKIFCFLNRTEKNIFHNHKSIKVRISWKQQEPNDTMINHFVYNLWWHHEAYLRPLIFWFCWVPIHFSIDLLKPWQKSPHIICIDFFINPHTFLNATVYYQIFSTFGTFELSKQTLKILFWVSLWVVLVFKLTRAIWNVY